MANLSIYTLGIATILSILLGAYITIFDSSEKNVGVWNHLKYFLKITIGIIPLMSIPTIMGVVIYALGQIKHLEPDTYYTHELVSLENSVDKGWQIEGSTFLTVGSVSGGTRSEHTCSFFSKDWNGEIKHQSYSLKDITFREGKDAKVEWIHKRTYNPFFYGEEIYWGRLQKIVVTIPKENVKRYIKFN